MKKLLVLTSRFPYPVIGGDRLRVINICLELSKHYQLTLLSLCESRDEIEYPIPSNCPFVEVNRVLLPRWRSYANVILHGVSQTPLQIAYYRSQEFADQLDVLVERHDAIFAHLIRTADYLIRRQYGKPVFVDMCDAISMNYMRIRKIRQKRGLRSRVFSFEALRLEKYERDVAAHFDLVSFVSPIDIEYLYKTSVDSRAIIIPNGVNGVEYPFLGPGLDESIAFIGNMTSVQNIDACLYFIEEILPLVRQSLSHVSLLIIGNIDSKTAASLRKYDGVRVTGRVASIAEAARGARAAICPMRIGAGVQNKILEYMALGLPTVTTNVGLEGIVAEPGRDILVADTPYEFATQLCQLLESKELSATISLNGRKLIENHYRWSTNTQKLVVAIDKLFR